MKRQANGSIKDMEKSCKEVSLIMKALAHPQRLMLLCHLSTGEKSVGELEELCGTSQSSMSQFLNRMRLEGLVISEKRGLYVYYSIFDPRIEKLINALYHIYCR